MNYACLWLGLRLASLCFLNFQFERKVLAGIFRFFYDLLLLSHRHFISLGLIYSFHLYSFCIAKVLIDA